MSKVKANPCIPQFTEKEVQGMLFMNKSSSTKMIYSATGLIRHTVVFILILVMAGVALAQGTRGSIRGKVTDPQGAIVPGASVKLIDVARNRDVATVQTDAEGAYQFLELEPADYSIVINAAGFTETKLAVKVEPNRNLQLDSVLTVGGATAEVEVTATQELVDRETPTLGTTVDTRRVTGLPLNGRNVLNLALLQPGVAPVSASDETNLAFGNGTGIRVNGSRGVENNITLDGSNNNEIAVGGATGGQPRPDAVQEFRLLTSNFEAEFGRNTGSVINVVTRSGTNDFHGNARIFWRPTILSAARYFDNQRTTPIRGTDDFRRKFERKEFGGNIGGPIYLPHFGEGGPVLHSGKNRAFFFVDYERRAQLIGDTRRIVGTPTNEEQAGIFTRDIDNPLIDPSVSTTANRIPFPIISTSGDTIRQQIPASRISQIARFYNQFLPATTNGSASVGADRITNNHYLTARVDYLATSKQTVNFTFNFFDSIDSNPFAFGGADVPGFGAANLDRTYNAVIRHTYTLSPTIVNSLLLGYARNDQPGVAPQNTVTPQEIGFTSNFVANNTFAGPPYIVFDDRGDGVNGLKLGNSIQGPQARVTSNFQIQDSVSWAVGDHRFKFGVDGTKYLQDQTFLFVNQGILIYSGVSGLNTTGDDYADFLIGNSPAAVQFGANGLRDFRQFAVAAFGQDTWRVSDSLTLSLGLRYEYNSPLTDLFNRVAYYRPGSISQLLTSGQLRTPEGLPIVVPPGGRAPNGLVYPGDPDNVLGGVVPDGGVARDMNNFAPRIGIAYAPEAKSGFMRKIFGEREGVLRAGFGVFYGAIIGDTALQQLNAPGFNGTNAFFFPASGTTANVFAPDPFPLFGDPLDASPNQGQIRNPFAQSQVNVRAPLTQMSRPVDPNIRTPYTYQYNLTFERGFRQNYVVQLSYVGNRGRKLYAQEQVNPALGTFVPPPPGRTIPTPTANNANSRRLNPDIQLGLDQFVAGGNSWYNAFEVNFQRRYSNGLLFQLAYTFSKSMNDVGDSSRGNLDLVDRRFGRSLSDDDVPHRLVGSFIYDLPFARSFDGARKVLLDGWSLGGIVTLSSATPFSVPNPVDTTGICSSTGRGGCYSFADLGNAFTELEPRENAERAFNADAFRAVGLPGSGFVLARDFRRGTAGRNQFRAGNAINNVDFVLIKKTGLGGERANLELRFEAFNAFNHAQFVNNVTTPLNVNLLDTAGFGKFTGTRESRVIQLGARISF